MVSQILGRHTTGFVRGRRYLLLAEVLQQMNIDVTQFRNMQVPVSDEMKRLGWTPSRIRIFGKVTRVWLAPTEGQP